MQFHTIVGEVVITPASVAGAMLTYGAAAAMHATTKHSMYAAMGGYALTNLAVGVPINLAALDILGAAIVRPLSLSTGLAVIHHLFGPSLG
jgi:hypothetical protein